MTNTTNTRARAFVNAFIRDEKLCPAFGSTSDDWINDEDRMARCTAAAENGADGSTHAEVINDWREAFARFLRERGNRFDRFERAVTAEFDAIEAWHEAIGSLNQEIG
jgi:hypothetical protein